MSRRAVGLLFALALACRLAYAAALWHVLPIWHVDALGYHNSAVNVLQRGVFSLDAVPPFQPDAVRTPGYPAFIALIYAAFGEAPRAVIVAQAVVDSITALLVTGIAFKLLGGSGGRKARAAWLAGAVYAVYPTAWHYSLELYAEALLAFALALFFFAALRPGRRQPLWLGAACALNLLIKPNVVALPVVGLMILWAQAARSSTPPDTTQAISKALRSAMLFVCATTLLLPWVIRNARVFGRPMLSTVFEFNLAYVSAPFTLAQARGQPVGIWSAEFNALYGEVYERAAARDPALFAVSVRRMTPAQIDRHQRLLAEVGAEIVRAHPVAFVSSQFSQIARTWLPYDHKLWFTHLTSRNWDETVPEPFLPTLMSGQTVSRLAGVLFFAFHGLYALGLIATLVGAWRLLRFSQSLTRVVVLAMAVVIAYMTVLPGPIGYERFRAPVMPLVCALMAGAFAPAPVLANRQRPLRTDRSEIVL